MALPPEQQEAIHLNATPAVFAPSSRPDAKTQKYDRQLRLWAATGQSALENASILVVNGGATASSSLKNLVLPGIGKFTILDPSLVDESDLGNNFFLSSETSLGKPRAEEVCRYLKELNEDVEGNAIVQDLTSFLSSSASPLSPYSLILAINVPPTTPTSPTASSSSTSKTNGESVSALHSLTQKAWEEDVPLIEVRTNGFYGMMRTQAREVCIIETHPESLVDMRIHNPFPSLLSYAETFDFDQLDSEEHAHIPAVVILIKGLEGWKRTHDGKGPTGTKERKEFTNLVLQGKRNNDEENFDEAVELFRRAGVKPAIPDEIAKLFQDPSCTSISSSSSNFWLLLSALSRFTTLPSNPSHLLPLSGALPDMKASTTRYVSLQNLYKAKAKEDLQVFEEVLRKVLQEVGVTSGDEAGVIGGRVGREEMESFVKHSGYLKVLRGRSLKEEDEVGASLKGRLGDLIRSSSYSELPDHSLWISLAFQSSTLFHSKHHRYPGTAPADEDGSQDVQELEEIANGLVKKLGGFGLDGDEEMEAAKKEEFGNVLRETCRAGASDLPQIAALMGGLVGQEAIKLTTKQYVPLNGTAVWDGITSALKVVG